jgi:hypothetical protein
MSPSLPQDAAMPQLPLALDGAAMAEVFADVLRPHGMRVEACNVERVKYRPGRNATLAYRLTLRDPQQRTIAQHVAARLCGGEGAQRAVRASAATLAASPAGPALRWLPALDMLTWWWPNDAKLRAPRLLACERRLRDEALPALLPLMGVPSGAEVDIDLDIVQYVPEHRLCARVDLQWRDDSGATQQQRVYAKTSREPDGATAHGLLAQLQASAAWREGRLHTPRALLWHAPTELYWQEGLPGQPLHDMGATVTACASALGAQIAALHATPLQTPRTATLDDMRARLAQVVERLTPVLGDDPLHRAAQAINGGWHALDGWPLATLHGDLHMRNILVTERNGPHVSLIDLDGLHRGPALLELGAWVADAMYHALLDGARAERDKAAWCALINGYSNVGGTRPDPRALRWATAWSLLTQRAWRCVINLKPGRFALAPRLVALATELVGVREIEAC